ncbi:MAG: Aspartyl-tRNA(Asn) amidotransferase subunit C @ Glutamyl-tRNA(Gln) amidotransferase subunit C, partial [uncultured Solirubrobacteraceae bacterium]
DRPRAGAPRRPPGPPRALRARGGADERGAVQGAGPHREAVG